MHTLIYFYMFAKWTHMAHTEKNEQYNSRDSEGQKQFHCEWCNTINSQTTDQFQCIYIHNIQRQC